MVEKLSKKDMRILAELDKDSRQPDSQIAKKIGLSKQVVNYRINNLVDKGVISQFYTTFDISRMGFNSYYVFIQLEKITSTKEKEYMKKLETLDYVGWLMTGIGRWDVCLLIYADTLEKFDHHLTQIIELFGDSLHDYNFTMLLKSEHISYKFVSRSTDSKILQEENKEKVQLDTTSLALIKALSSNARISLTDIEKTTRIPMYVASYRIKAMKKQNLLLGYKVRLDVASMGYEWHLLLLKLQPVSERRKKEFFSFCENHKNVYYLTRTIGLYNLMVDIHVRSNDEFRQILQTLRESYPDVIKIYESIVVFKEHKISYYPEELTGRNAR
ncbi:Lrp/AsnC family transcriptional regulator [Candidatus Woesearchaeota archaeon]|nr:Lrp/AsnC family transcriptional regulator [Candidatus Woesearchaeota archaeon]